MAMPPAGTDLKDYAIDRPLPMSNAWPGKAREFQQAEFFRQEFYCEWLDTEGGLFSYDDIQAALALGEDVEALEIGEEW